MNVREVRRLAMSLPEVTEEPHFDRSSFRLRGKIFATVAPDGSSINVFVDDATREMMTTVDPKAYETLWWGKKIAGLQVRLARAKGRDVGALLNAGWQRKAPKKLLSTSTD
jgi:hypothetical protein